MTKPFVLSDEDIEFAIQFNEQQDFEPQVIANLRVQLGLPSSEVWDAAAVQAVADFQQGNGLEANGNVGPETYEQIARGWPEVEQSGLEGAFDLALLLEGAVREAEKDWQAGTSEADVSKGGGLAAIFRDSGWSPHGVDKGANGLPKDWCGMAVGSWLVRAGMDLDHRKSFFATSNVHSQFTYGARGSSHRTKKEVLVDGSWRLVKGHHEAKGARRRWIDFKAVRETPLADLDIQPGDVVLINHVGGTDGAHHIAMVRSWDGEILETIEGNAGGLGPDDMRRREAVIVNRRNLTQVKDRKKIFGIGRLSELDFTDLVCR